MGELRPGWKRWRFEQIAVSVTDRIDNPSEAGVEYYVGLEHLDSDSLKVRRWGSPDDVSATKLLFEPGDIIFGRRRAYQRKLGVAAFRGIASAHSLVLRAKPQVVLPEFLPFFMQSDVFMERAQRISVGSLSPTINWKTLAKEEFALPPLEEQVRLAHVLRCIEECSESYTEVLEAIQSLRIATTEDYVRHRPSRTALGDLIHESAYGSSRRASKERPHDSVAILRIPNVLREEVDFTGVKFVRLKNSELERYELRNGDLLLVRTNGNPDYVGRCVVVGDMPERCVYASYLIRLRFDSTRVLPSFVATMLNTPSIRRELRGAVRSSAGNYNINTKGICGQRIPTPPLHDQDVLVRRVGQLDADAEAVRGRAGRQRVLKMRVLAECLS